jgi:hypothetical protein
MHKLQLTILQLVLFLSVSVLAGAQGIPVAKWDSQKIKGTRHLPYPGFMGSPFLNDTWLLGKIEFVNGDFADSLPLRHSSLKDEIIYYNQKIASQIVIDKASLKGFTLIEKDGQFRQFRKQYFDGFLHGDRYMEVLYDGQIDLLAYRKTSLTGVSPYHDESGALKNMAYFNSHQFYCYSPEKGYSNVRISKSGFYSKFTKSDQKEIRKLLRKNRLKISDEKTFVEAWKTVDAAGFSVVF